MGLDLVAEEGFDGLLVFAGGGGKAREFLYGPIAHRAVAGYRELCLTTFVGRVRASAIRLSARP